MSSGLSGRLRNTLVKPTTRYAGTALHSGVDSWIEVSPAAPQAGIVFLDDATGQEIPVRPENVRDTTRCTQLAVNGVAVQTVEHLLSALAGLRIDDASIRIHGGELPAGDGSALPFVELLLTAGIKPHADALPVRPLIVARPRTAVGADGAFVLIMPARGFRLTVALDYPDYAYLGTQVASYDLSVDNYIREIAPARTYGFLNELAWLHEHGLALGASAENALVLGDTEYLSSFRFDNEPARHKALDFIGDLSLIGRPIQAEVFAFKPSHALNVKLAELLIQDDPILATDC